MAAILSSYLYIGRNLARLANQQTLEVEARRTLAQFNRDVRMASGLTDTGTLGSAWMSLTIPSESGTNTVTYYYNNGSSAATVAVNGTNVSMAANALTRCVYNGTTVTSFALLNNITAGGLTLRYYDTSDREYTTYSYLSGIKQLSLEFTTQLGVSGNGTQTRAYSVSSNRLVVRNRGFLP